MLRISCMTSGCPFTRNSPCVSSALSCRYSVMSTMICGIVGEIPASAPKGSSSGSPKSSSYAPPIDESTYDGSSPPRSDLSQSLMSRSLAESSSDMSRSVCIPSYITPPISILPPPPCDLISRLPLYDTQSQWHRSVTLADPAAHVISESTPFRARSPRFTSAFPRTLRFTSLPDFLDLRLDLEEEEECDEEGPSGRAIHLTVRPSCFSSKTMVLVFCSSVDSSKNSLNGATVPPPSTAPFSVLPEWWVLPIWTPRRHIT